LLAAVVLVGCTAVDPPSSTPDETGSDTQSSTQAPSSADASPVESSSANGSPQPAGTGQADIWSNPEWSAEQAQAVGVIREYTAVYDQIAVNFAGYTQEQLDETLSQYWDDGVIDWEIDNIMTAGEAGYVRKSAETPIAVRITNTVEDQAVDVGRSGDLIYIAVCVDLSSYELVDGKGETVKSGRDFVNDGEHYAPYSYTVFVEGDSYKIFEADYSAAGSDAPCW
jgi:hypothetical protein